MPASLPLARAPIIGTIRYPHATDATMQDLPGGADTNTRASRFPTFARALLAAVNSVGESIHDATSCWSLHPHRRPALDRHGWQSSDSGQRAVSPCRRTGPGRDGAQATRTWEGEEPKGMVNGKHWGLMEAIAPALAAPALPGRSMASLIGLLVALLSLGFMEWPST